LRPVEVASVPATGLARPLALLDEALRDGDPVPEDFADRLRKAVEAGDVEVLSARARAENQMLGVVVLAYRLSVSASQRAGSSPASKTSTCARKPDARASAAPCSKRRMSVAQSTISLTLKHRSKTTQPKHSTPP